jgi:hypothetical protein
MRARRSSKGDTIEDRTKTLIEHGAQPSAPRSPNQVVVMRPDEVDRALRWFEGDSWLREDYAVSVLKASSVGDRAVIYETGSDRRGLVGFWDVADLPVRQNRWGYLAPGVIRPLPTPVRRSQLLADPLLKTVFASPRGGRRLSYRARRALVPLLDPLPDFLFLPPTHPSSDGDFDSAPPVGRRWLSEREMQLAIQASPRCWELLGFVGRPGMELVSEDRRDRYDLISDRAVAELKLEANLETLAQLDRYLVGRRRREPGRWRGHIVFARWATRGLREALADRTDVALWQCRPGPTGARLVDAAGENEVHRQVA